MVAIVQHKSAGNVIVFPHDRLFGRARVIAERSIRVQPKTLDRIWRNEWQILDGAMERLGLSIPERDRHITDFVRLVDELTTEVRARRDARVARYAFLSKIPPSVWDASGGAA